MSLILSIETATGICSIALHREGTVLGRSDLCLEKSHSNMLATMIKQLVANTGFNMVDLQAVAVSKGPGSYTGLRIGVSTAKGLCVGLGIPLIAVNTLEALAVQMTSVYGKEYWYCPMIDARRMEVYSLMADHRLQSILHTAPVVIDEQSFQEQLDQNPILFFGNGAAKCQEIIIHPAARFISGVESSALGVGTLAYEKFKKEHFEDLAYFEPFYLKEFKGTQPKKKVGIIK